MEVQYEPASDALYLRLTSEETRIPVNTCSLETPDFQMAVDVDEHGKIVGIEILDASHVLRDPGAIRHPLFRELTGETVVGPIVVESPARRPA